MMKRSILLIMLIAFLGCNDTPKEAPENALAENEEPTQKTENPLMGAWELTSFYNYENNEVIDSFQTREGYRQVKIYSPTKVMWSKQVPSDSTEWFGYGSYLIVDNQLVEILDYGSEMMSKIIEERKEFKYDLNLTENTFSQIEIDDDGNRIYSENYKRIE